MGQHSAHVRQAARESAEFFFILGTYAYVINRLGYAQITEEPVDVEQGTPVQVAYARDGAVRVGPHERDGAYGWRRREGACGASVAAERRIQLAPAVRMCGEKGVENRGRVELCAG